jgi:hypothetical protein
MQVLYVFLAAAFGYLAAALHKRYEAVRSTAVEVDLAIHRVLNLLKADDAGVPSGLNDQIEVLEEAETHALGLPNRLLRPVRSQIHTAMFVVEKSFGESTPEFLPTHAAIEGVREVLAPLLRPHLLPPRAGKPKSFPEPDEFSRLIRTRGVEEAFAVAGTYHDKVGYPAGFLGELWEAERRFRQSH